MLCTRGPDGAFHLDAQYDIICWDWSVQPLQVILTVASILVCIPFLLLTIRFFLAGSELSGVEMVNSAWWDTSRDVFRPLYRHPFSYADPLYFMVATLLKVMLVVVVLSAKQQGVAITIGPLVVATGLVISAWRCPPYFGAEGVTEMRSTRLMPEAMPGAQSPALLTRSQRSRRHIRSTRSPTTQQRTPTMPTAVTGTDGAAGGSPKGGKSFSPRSRLAAAAAALEHESITGCWRIACAAGSESRQWRRRSVSNRARLVLDCSLFVLYSSGLVTAIVDENSIMLVSVPSISGIMLLLVGAFLCRRRGQVRLCP